jgi:GTP cyclohydrolase I
VRNTHLRPKGVGVVIEAEHLCVMLRGVQATGARTITSTLLGTLRDDARSRAESFAVAGLGPRWSGPGRTPERRPPWPINACS